MAGHLAGAIGARRLIIAGGTAGVLDESGATIPTLTLESVDAMIASGKAHSGMVAKLVGVPRRDRRGGSRGRDRLGTRRE